MADIELAAVAALGDIEQVRVYLLLPVLLTQLLLARVVRGQRVVVQKAGLVVIP